MLKLPVLLVAIMPTYLLRKAPVAGTNLSRRCNDDVVTIISTVIENNRIYPVIKNQSLWELNIRKIRLVCSRELQNGNR